jgi:hypothetical protein
MIGNGFLERPDHPYDPALRRPHTGVMGARRHRARHLVGTSLGSWVARRSR